MADSGPSNRSTPKFTRCRTGCLRCRVRRRKCDEKKPKCQNCIDKDLVCQYGLQVSFLEKNTFTVSAKELRRPKNDVAYGKVQFVKEDPLCATGASSDGSLSPIPSPITDVALSQDSIPVEQDSNGQNRQGYERRASDTNGDRTSHNGLPSVDHIPREQLQSALFSDRDESAVRGLLALGSSNNANNLPNVSEETARISDFDPNIMLSPLTSTYAQHKDGPSPIYLPSIDTANGKVISDPSAIDYLSLPDSERLDLLRHYRYHVAPWLDICDMRQPFGLTVLQLALGSEQLFSALLRLSKACTIQNALERNFLAGFPEPIAHITGSSTEANVLYVFERARALVSNISGIWNRTGYPDSIHSLVQHAYDNNMDSALYWMTLRLDLGVALANDSSIQLPLPISPIPSISLLSRSDDTYERIRHYAHSILWLIANVLIICHEESNQLPHDLMDSWLQVFEELNQWYHLRPLEFQPMIELEGDDQVFHPEGGFPLLLFANGAGAFSNQLYHTAMLLLLQSKPRTVLLHNAPSRFSSPLWHAQRICGIALNNDRRECWDPCLLVSFLIAARLMTHESQQKEILQGFDRIKVLTGWDVGEDLIHLREDWSFSEGG